jgi:tyrosinase
MTIANENPDNPIEKVLEFAKEATETTDPQLIRWSLMIFITHHPSARNQNLRIPPLVQRSPESSVPKKKKVSIAPGPVISDEKVGESEDDMELLMNWYREDPNFNEHHEHWHLVYTGQGIPDVKNPKKRVQKDRHGELFIYMHRQMLARYDVERLGINLPLVKPLDDYRAPIEEGYKPNENLVDIKDDYTTFGSREPNSVLRDFKDFKIDDMENNRKEIEAAIEKDEFWDGTKIDINLLGAVVESYELQEKKELIDSYGKLHMAGHVVIARINDDPGVMYDTRTAARDPAFWRWHRHIDNLINTWEEKQGPNDFSNSPPVNLQDVILVFKDKLPINHGETQDEEATAFGEQTFGGENFDTDVSNSEYVTDELQTKMKSRTWTHIEDSGLSEEIDYLFPREFYYYFRVENTSSSSFNATFRVFIVPEELAESRRHWIELDKFKETLPPNSKTVVCRDCDMSSVVRQPPQKTEDELDDTALPFDTADRDNNPNKTFCDCGWPFHLLIPRGRKEGMKFKLLVFISDWTEDEVPRISRCGSISYCGAEGPADKYPDKKPMGYPLDRPFRNNSYEEVRKENYFEIISWKRNQFLLIFILLNFTDVCWIK